LKQTQRKTFIEIFFFERYRTAGFGSGTIGFGRGITGICGGSGNG
jgi:hypothetical protein